MTRHRLALPYQHKLVSLSLAFALVASLLSTSTASDHDVVARISAGAFHTCAVIVHDVSGDEEMSPMELLRRPHHRHIHCWGRDVNGQARVPRSVARSGGFDWVEVSSGYFHSCGVYHPTGDTEKMACWGDNGVGCAEVPPDAASLLEKEGLETLLTGEAHTCLQTKEGSLMCWGDKDSGLNLAFSAHESDMGESRSICLGSQHMCAVTKRGELRCWGKLWTHDEVATPAAPHSIVDSNNRGRTYEKAVCGKEHTCAIASDHTLFCFGRDDYDQSTVPLPSSVRDTTAVTTSQDGKKELLWRDVCVGCLHTCGILGDGRLYCWGARDEGQLSIPEKYKKSGAAMGVTCGCWHTCVKTLAGRVQCFGHNSEKQVEVPLHFHDGAQSLIGNKKSVLLAVAVSALLSVMLYY